MVAGDAGFKDVAAGAAAAAAGAAAATAVIFLGAFVFASESLLSYSSAEPSSAMGMHRAKPTKPKIKMPPIPIACDKRFKNEPSSQPTNGHAY